MMPDLLETRKKEIAELCRLYSVKELMLFGSAAKGILTDKSDFDLLIEFEPDAEIGFLTLSKLEIELETLLGRPVDLVPKLGLKPTIRQTVLSEAELLYAA